MAGSAVKREIVPLMIMYFMMQMFLTPQFGYLSLFYQNRGMTTGEISLLFGIAPFISVFGQYFWSGVADKAKHVNGVIFVVSVCTLLIIPFFLIGNTFTIMLVVACGYNVFSTSLTPLIDTTCIYYASESGFPFGRIRLMGSIGYMICMLVTGFVVQVNIDFMFYMQVILGVAFILLLPMAPKVTMPKMKKAAFNPMIILRKPSVIMAMIVACPIFLSFGFNITFYGPYLVKELGAPSSFIGLSSVVSIGVEVIFLLFMDKMVSKIPIKYLLFGIAAIVSLRWLVYATTDNVFIVMAFFGIEGISSVATYFFVSYYLKRVAPPEGKASTQTLASIFCYCLCKGCGSLFGSSIMEMMGSQKNAYMFFFIIVAAGAIILLLSPVKFTEVD